METEQKGFQKEELVAALKKHWKLISLAILVLLFLFFRETMLQIGLLLLVVIGLVYVLYKAAFYALAIGLTLIRVVISILAIGLTVGIVVFVLGSL